MPLPRNILGTDSAVGSTRGLSAQQAAVWGRIIGVGPDDDSPFLYEWEEVYLDDKGEWQSFAEDESDLAPANDSILSGNALFNPAIEINEGGGIAPGTVVRLVPGPFAIAQPQNVSHRAWLFSNPKSGLRPFKLTGTQIPAGGVGASVAGGAELELDKRATAEWLDEVGTAVTLFPSHKNEFVNEDAHLRLGIGRGEGAYMLATYGWAQFQPNATAVTDPVDGKKKFEGEWQIVRLEAETIARVVLPTGADIEPDERGLGNLWWRDADNEAFRLIDSTYQLEIYNDTNTTLKAGEELNVWFDVDGYVWRPFLTVDSPTFAKVVTAHPGNDDGGAVRTFKLRPCDHDGANTGGAATEFDGITELMPAKDTNLIVGNVVRYEVLADGDKIIVSDIWDLPIGRTVWESLDKTNLRQGWRLCDGTQGAAFAGNSPDLSDLFIKMIDAVGEAVGDTSGFKLHGPVGTNSHGDHTKASIVAVIDGHDDHSTIQVAAALQDHQHQRSSGLHYLQGDEVIPSDHIHDASGAGNNLAHSAHGVDGGEPDLTHTSTSNEPQHYAMAALQRCDQRA